MSIQAPTFHRRALLEEKGGYQVGGYCIFIDLYVHGSTRSNIRCSRVPPLPKWALSCESPHRFGPTSYDAESHREAPAEWFANLHRVN